MSIARFALVAALTFTRAVSTFAQLGDACATETQALLSGNPRLLEGGVYVGGLVEGCDISENSVTTKCTINGAANATAFKALCEQAGGQYFSVTYNVVCETTLTATSTAIVNEIDYQDYNICLGTSCNANEVDDYLESSQSSNAVAGTTTTCTTTSNGSPAPPPSNDVNNGSDTQAPSTPSMIQENGSDTQSPSTNEQHSGSGTIQARLLGSLLSVTILAVNFYF